MTQHMTHPGIPPPAHRRIRVFAFDPSLDIDLETAVINQTTIHVPWERLDPGPVGEYLEVIDHDPASQCFYPPVNLDEPNLLAQDGLAPSTANPQFHQQMVYAVAMATIRNFERALGRRALWHPHITKRGKIQKEYFLQRLRIYPHALREANAYYSPEKKALLFGYFPATAAAHTRILPGGIVFSCLSHDVIAHEITHALLDSVHPRFIDPSNADVLAFHEAFADLVALFQHFSYPEVLRHQIAKTRGDLASENLLAQLAQEFGQGTGRYGSLRDALGGQDDLGVWRPKANDPTELERAQEPHARGSILVAAIFDAFVSIYKSRIADLLRIASEGTGVLPDGALHPDLVGRLAIEAAKSARHVLQMCIRALDYCPPIDITFGEYLRALITADYDLVRDDDRGYRIAMVEAFRRRGIYPRHVRSLSEDSLRWRPPSAKDQKLFRLALSDKALREIRETLRFWTLESDREGAFEMARKHAAMLREVLVNDLSNGWGHEIGQLLGLDLQANADSEAAPFKVHSVRPARRVDPDGQQRQELVISITQRKRVPLNPESSAPKPREIDFRGGCTMIIDLEAKEPLVRYVIIKRISNEQRLNRQREFMRESLNSSLRATYFGEMLGVIKEPFALLHRQAEGES